MNMSNTEEYDDPYEGVIDYDMLLIMQEQELYEIAKMELADEFYS